MGGVLTSVEYKRDGVYMLIDARVLSGEEDARILLVEVYERVLRAWSEALRRRASDAVTMPLLAEATRINQALYPDDNPDAESLTGRERILSLLYTNNMRWSDKQGRDRADERIKKLLGDEYDLLTPNDKSEEGNDG